MTKKKLLFSVIFFMQMLSSYAADSDIVHVYIVDRNDYEFSNILLVYSTQEKLDIYYKSIVFVYDKSLDSYIDGVGFYEYERPSNLRLKRIVEEAERNYKKNKVINKLKGRNDPFDGIFGVRWSMSLSQVQKIFQKYGLYKWYSVKEGSVLGLKDLYWEGTMYNAIHISFYTSNLQNTYVHSLTFSKRCSTAEEARTVQKNIYYALNTRYRNNQIVSKTKENNFRSYTVFKQMEHGSISAINLFISKNGIDKNYYVNLEYSGLLEASLMLNIDNGG